MHSRIKFPAAEQNYHLFVFAHPDDEFGCFEIIRRTLDSNRQCFFAYLTDGSYGGQDHKIREKESIQVLRSLGADPSKVWFIGREHGIADGRMTDSLEIAYIALQSRLENLGTLRRIYLPAWEGGHQDHDATFLVGLAVAHNMYAQHRAFQYPLYNAWHVPKGLFRVLTPLPENGQAKKLRVPIKWRALYVKACMTYMSQWRSWVGLLPFFILKMLVGRHYYLQKISRHWTLQRPHTGELLYESRGRANWNEFKRQVISFYAERINIM